MPEDRRRRGPAAVDAEDDIAAFQVRSDRPGLVRLGGHLGLIGVLAGLATLAPAGWYWPLAFLQGVAMVFLFCPLHETTHRTAFRSRWLNRVVGELAGFLLMLPPRWFGAFHMAHHRFTQDPERDPELATRKPTDWRAFLLVLSGAVYWRFAITGLLRRALGPASAGYLDARTARRAVVEARVYVGAYLALAMLSAATGSAALVWLWVVPVALGQPVLRLYLLAEHWGCPSVRDMWANTRTLRTLAPVRWLAWNMPFHAEHHANPGVPWHRLPDFAASPLARPQVVQDGYARFHADRLRDVAAGRAGPI